MNDTMQPPLSAALYLILFSPLLSVHLYVALLHDMIMKCRKKDEVSRYVMIMRVTLIDT